MKRRVNPGSNGPGYVLQAIGALPHHPLVVDNRGRKGWDLRLLAQRVQGGAKDLVDQDLRVRRHADEQNQDGGSGDSAQVSRL